MRRLISWKTIVTLFAIATIIYAIKTKQSHGRFIGVPFEFRPPTPQRFFDRWWNPRDPRIFTEHVFGIGWSINLYQVKVQLLGVFQDARTALHR
jgi:uncharacterized membrane protein